MNVGELKEALAGYADVVSVMIEKSDSTYVNVQHVGDATIIGAPTVVLTSDDL